MTTSLLQWTAARPRGGASAASWICQLVAAAILAQTLFFKFTYAPETRVIFAELGGRPAATAAGVAELLCVLLLLTPRTALLGALASLGVIGGAIATHLFVVGIQIVDPQTGQGDGGLLFGLAVVVATLAVTIIVLRTAELVALIDSVRRRF